MASLTLTYHGRDGRVVVQRGLLANAAGDVDLIEDYWGMAACAGRAEYECRLEIGKNGTFRGDIVGVFLPTK